jgi:hypothetical protein
MILRLEEVPRGIPLYVFGAGRAGELLAEGLGRLSDVVLAGFVDNFRRGTVGGLSVFSWRDFLTLADAESSVILLASQYHEEILQGLTLFPLSRLRNAYPLVLLLGQRELEQRCLDLQGRCEQLQDRYQQLEHRYRQEVEQKREYLAWSQRIIQQYRSYAEAADWQVRALQAEHFGPGMREKVPPAQIPKELIDGYSMQGAAVLSFEYRDSSYPATRPLIYGDEEIDAYLAKIARGESYYYVETDDWLRVALDRYPLENKIVAIIGSRTPWFESTCLSRGARPVTIDYNPILLRTSRLASMTVAEWEQTRPRFEFALCISSVEHSGLGRYGDPLDPDGDIRAMERLKEIVTPGGLLFLSVPVVRDELVFNSHRRYGPHRLPRLLNGWQQVDVIGWNRRFDGPEGSEPVFILQNS